MLRAGEASPTARHSTHLKTSQPSQPQCPPTSLPIMQTTSQPHNHSTPHNPDNHSTHPTSSMSFNPLHNLTTLTTTWPLTTLRTTQPTSEPQNQLTHLTTLTTTWPLTTTQPTSKPHNHSTKHKTSQPSTLILNQPYSCLQPHPPLHSQHSPRTFHECRLL